MQTYTLLGVVVSLGRAEISLESPDSTLIRRKRNEEVGWLQLVRLDHHSEALPEDLLLPTWDKDIIKSLELKEGEVVQITIARA